MAHNMLNSTVLIYQKSCDMKFFLPELKRVMAAMVYANHASNLNQLNQLLEHDGIPPTHNIKQNESPERSPTFSPKSSHLSLVD